MPKIRAMAVVHNAALVDLIVDGGESAKSLNRPGVARLLAMVDAGQVQTMWKPAKSITDRDTTTQTGSGFAPYVNPAPYKVVRNWTSTLKK